MSAVVTVLLAFTLLLAPIFAALPDAPSVIASSEWTSILCAGTFFASFLSLLAARRGAPFDLRLSASEKTFLVLLGLSFLSIPVRLAVQHGTGYFGVMLRGWSLLAANFALFALARRVASSPVCLYVLIAAAVAGSAIVADIGVQEYIVHLRAGGTFMANLCDFHPGLSRRLLRSAPAGDAGPVPGGTRTARLDSSS